jgi:hypothetical protein
MKNKATIVCKKGKFRFAYDMDEFEDPPDEILEVICCECEHNGKSENTCYDIVFPKKTEEKVDPVKPKKKYLTDYVEEEV